MINKKYTDLEKSPLLLLHLSDLHFGPHSRFADTDPIDIAGRLHQAIEDEKTRRGVDVAVSLAIITGDIAEAARPSEYDDARAFFEELSQKLRLDRSRLVFVPGNHDVSWAACIRCQADQMDQGFDDDALRSHMDDVKFENFEKFVMDLCGVHRSEIGISLGRGAFVYNFDDIQVSVGALNSCELESNRAVDHRGFISDHQAQNLIQHWTQPGQKDWLKIMAVHHNPVPTVPDNVLEWIEHLKLLEQEKKLTSEIVVRFAADAVGLEGREYLEAVAEDCQVQLILHGHHHVSAQGLWPWKQHGKGYSHVLSAGSWGLAENHLPKDQPNAVQLILLDTNQSTLNSWLLEYEPRARAKGNVARGHFVPDSATPNGYSGDLILPDGYGVLPGAPNIPPLGEERQLESSTMPPRDLIVPRFVGREAELDYLNTWLLDPQSKMWVLAGDGGKGKTAIAYEFASRVRDQAPKNFEIIIWLSAKLIRFTDGRRLDSSQQDFWDLESALDRVLDAYGSLDFGELTIDEKRKEVLNYLNRLPGLIVLDDIDTLEGSAMEALTFFAWEATKTASKVLFTSRRVPFGMSHLVTQVDGFDTESEDGIIFVKTRIEMFGLESRRFRKSNIREIVRICDGCPLFIEDLLRLCLLGETPSQAINSWPKDQGEEARKYALGREFDALSPSAQRVLLTCSLFHGPCSLPDIVVASQLPNKTVQFALQELQSLFLLPKPSYVEDIPRFSLNLNTRLLVLDVQGKSDLARRIEGSIKSIIGQQPILEQRTPVGQYIRQAVSLVKLEKHRDAESTLLAALDRFPGSADLQGSLGWVYKSWDPPLRFTDARINFRLAFQLKSQNQDMYRHWWSMEARQDEWSRAAEAAEAGLGLVQDGTPLRYMAGYACSRLGTDLHRQAQNSRAEQEGLRAEQHLKEIFNASRETSYVERTYRQRAYRALTLTYELLVRVSLVQEASRSSSDLTRHTRRLAKLLGKTISQWKKEYPDDLNIVSESERLVRQFGDIIVVIDSD